MSTAAQKKEEMRIVGSIKDGNQAAFGELYDRYSGAMYSICLKMLKDSDDAQDALQQSMVKAWKNIQSYDEHKASIYTWLLNITRNTCIDRIRSLNRKPEIQDIEQSVSYLDRSDKALENKLNTDVIGLKESLEKLQPDLRTLIHAAYFGGFTQQEISDKMEIPLGTVKTRMRTAIKELRKIFN